ncbi:MAG: hypothetical protein IT350_18630 [Deltaproteobacteria bacterium]|nr:hypothetical protein [Deltaproteobacteria bacterium]
MKLRILTCILMLACSSVAIASVYSPEDTVAAVEADERSGLIDFDTAALYKTYAFFAPDRLPAAYRQVASEPLHHECATGFLLKLGPDLKRVSPAVRDEIRTIAPNIPDLSRPPVASRPKSAITAPADFPDGYTPPNVYYTEHFALRYGDGASYTNDELEALGDIMEEVWDVEVTDMGYNAPYGSDDYFTDIYVGNSGNGAPSISFEGAYTTIYDSWPDTMAHIVMWPTILDYESSFKDIMSHEFYHVLQFQIALTGCFQHMSGSGSDWAVEATATWAEDEVFDDINNYAYFVDYHMQNVEQTIFAFSSGAPIQYSRAIYFKFLSENYGGRDALHHIWNDCNANIWYSVDSYLQDYETTTTFDTFPEFTRRTLFRDYEEGNLYDSPYVLDHVNDYPAAELYDTGKLPEPYGTAYVQFQPSGGETSLNLRVRGEPKYGNRDIDYDLTIAKQRANETVETETMTESGAGNVGDITVDGFGGEWTRIYLIVTPRVQFSGGSANGIPFSIQSSEGDDPLPPEPTGDDDDDDTDDDADDDDADDDDASDDDADDDDGGNACVDALELIYGGCDLSLMNGGSAMDAQEALDSCESGGGPWACVEACVDAVNSCGDLESCLTGQCGITTDDGGSSGDDDDDDDGGSCGC